MLARFFSQGGPGRRPRGARVDDDGAGAPREQELTDMGERARDHELGDERAEETDGAAEVEDSSEAESDGSVGQML